MKRATLAVFCYAIAFSGSDAVAADKDTRLYELRTYYCHPGKLDALNARFRDHTVKLFEKHGITNIGYWTPVENPEHPDHFEDGFSTERTDKS